MNSLIWNKEVTIIERNDYIICYSGETGCGIRLLPEYFFNIDTTIKEGIEDSRIPLCFALEDQETVRKIVSALIDAKILVKKEEKEKYSLREASLLLTDKCNFNCLHCCEDATGIQCGKGSELEYRDVCRIIDKLESMKIEELLISGGEPTLHKEFKKIITYIRKNFSGKIAMITNGSLIDSENLDVIINSLDSISISLDGCDRELVSKIRKRDVFDNVKNLVKLLHQRGFHNINVSAILPASIEVENKFLDLCKEWNVKPEMRNYSNTGRGKSNNTIIQEIFDNYIYNHGFTKYNPIANECIGGLKVCGAAVWNITIDSYGDVYPCNLLHDEKYKLGNILDNIDILDDYSDSSVYGLLSNIREFKNTPCQECEIKKLCWFCISEFLTYCDSPDSFEARCRIKKQSIYRELEEIR